MNRVEIYAVFDRCRMAVCAEVDATDEEILDLCNRQNPIRTPGGWFEVARTERAWVDRRFLPVPCCKHPGRVHFLVLS